MNEEKQDNEGKTTRGDNRQESKVSCLAGSATHWHLELFNEDRTKRRIVRKRKVKGLEQLKSADETHAAEDRSGGVQMRPFADFLGTSAQSRGQA